MCKMGEWAAVMAYAATYNIRDAEVINAVALEIGNKPLATPAALQAGIVKAFDKHGIHMV